MELHIGDIVRGEQFPTDDGRGPRAHYAIVVAFDWRGDPVAIIGTSVKVDERLVSSRNDFVLSRRECGSEAAWAATGLVKPTVFGRGGRQVALSDSLIRVCRVTVVGEARGKLLAWAHSTAR